MHKLHKFVVWILKMGYTCVCLMNIIDWPFDTRITNEINVNDVIQYEGKWPSHVNLSQYIYFKFFNMFKLNGVSTTERIRGI